MLPVKTWPSVCLPRRANAAPCAPTFAWRRRGVLLPANAVPTRPDLRATDQPEELKNPPVWCCPGARANSIGRRARNIAICGANPHTAGHFDMGVSGCAVSQIHYNNTTPSGVIEEEFDGAAQSHQLAGRTVQGMISVGKAQQSALHPQGLEPAVPHFALKGGHPQIPLPHHD